MGRYARTAERARVLDRYPDYAVDLVPVGGRFVAAVDGTVIAETTRALEVQESFHTPVVYFPEDAVRPGALERTDHHTRCPFKGDASYYALLVDGRRFENAVWSYEDPMEEVAGLVGHVAFYPDHVRVHRED
jgi:uncharacterized protein (DUF427 family)